VPPGWPLRPLLRWISLAGSAVVLGALGVANMHQQNFPFFLTAVLGLCVLTVAVFVLTEPRGGASQE
jgi:hypothetical protein